MPKKKSTPCERKGHFPKGENEVIILFSDAVRKTGSRKVFASLSLYRDKVKRLYKKGKTVAGWAFL